ncbi:MAG: TrmB family transcriptional regulator [Methanomassiliicoccales archaeon]|nr:MAG: TrmB family transcriptional regulator [Methanomassiliicoccales archaeon]
MNILEVLNLDLGEIEREYRKIASVLRNIGMTEYEARLLVATVAKTHGSADELAELSMVPRTSAYKALQALEKKGLVFSTKGRPTIYHAVDIEEMRRKYLSELNETFNKLNSIKGLLSEKGTPELVYTIAGKARVMTKIGEMIDTAMKRIVISSPMMKEIRIEHGKRFSEAIKRGVEIIIISEPMVKLPEATRVYRKNDLLATDIIIDVSMAIIASPGLDLCGFSDNPFIAKHLETFILNSLPKNGPEV